MTNKKSLPREDRKHLREFLSFNPFFREMESHLHKMAYGKNGYSDEHLCLEQIWHLAILQMRDEDAAWQLVENESHRLDFNEENTWHFLYANFIRTLYLNHNIHFANGKRNNHRTDSSQSDAQLRIQPKD